MKPIYTLFAGVNGAGKTTLFNMQDKDLGVRVNSDEIVVANGGDWRNPSDQARAMKEAVKLIKKCINNQCDFNQETTLTGKSIINNIIKAGEKGFKIKMNYIGLDNAGIAVERVNIRVSKGGHGIAKEDILRRYDNSLINLKEIIPLVDELTIYDNTKDLHVVAKISGDKKEIVDANCVWLKQIFQI